jgi:hypothetical protein
LTSAACINLKVKQVRAELVQKCDSDVGRTVKGLSWLFTNNEVAAACDELKAAKLSFERSFCSDPNFSPNLDFCGDTALPPAPAPAPVTQAYADGLADRQAWEHYYRSAQAFGQAFVEGADYWAAHRSLPGASCQPMRYEQQGQWQTGCLSAKLQLDPTDKRRLAEPEYRRGWNH